MKISFVLILTIISAGAFAQLCPGGGLDFVDAVTFNPGWIYGCNTGTSCNGGVNFDNRISCQPTTAMEACAPPPSCGSIPNNASNVWFKFYPTGPTALISCFQNTSLVIGIQAFSGGPGCGGLTQIGCALSSGPSSGVSLPLSGLLPGQYYYFRIFGSAGPVSQRTGLYCFCGTSGLSNTLLPIVISGFAGTTSDNRTELSWTTAMEYNSSYFLIEESSDGKTFTTAGKVYAAINSSFTRAYSISLPLATGPAYYRLKMIAADETFSYSSVIKLVPDKAHQFRAFFNTTRKELSITETRPERVLIYAIEGRLLKNLQTTAGTNLVPLAELPTGIYLLRREVSQAVQQFVVR